MKLSYALTAIFSATAAVAAPLTHVSNLCGAPVPVDASLLSKLSPDVAALVTGLGLTTLPSGLALILINTTPELKARIDSPVPVPDVPVDTAFLGSLTPKVSALVSSLGVTSISPEVASALNTLNQGLNTPDVGVPDIPVNAELLSTLTPEAAALVSRLGLTSIPAGLVGTLQSLGQALKASGVNVADIPVNADLLSKLTPEAAALIQKLGLTSVPAGLIAPVQSLGLGLKARGTTVPEVPGAQDVPVDAAFLSKLSPDVAALVTGLDVTSISPGLASTLASLSEGV